MFNWKHSPLTFFYIKVNIFSWYFTLNFRGISNHDVPTGSGNKIRLTCQRFLLVYVCKRKVHFPEKSFRIYINKIKYVKRATLNFRFLLLKLVEAKREKNLNIEICDWLCHNHGILKLNGNSERIAQVWRKIVLFWGKKKSEL